MRTSTGLCWSALRRTTGTKQRPLGLGIRGALLCSEDGERWMSARNSRRAGCVPQERFDRAITVRTHPGPRRTAPVRVQCTVTGGIRSNSIHHTGCAATQRPRWRTVQRPWIPPQTLRVHEPGVPSPCGGSRCWCVPAVQQPLPRIPPKRSLLHLGTPPNFPSRPRCGFPPRGPVATGRSSQSWVPIRLRRLLPWSRPQGIVPAISNPHPRALSLWFRPSR